MRDPFSLMTRTSWLARAGLAAIAAGALLGGFAMQHGSVNAASCERRCNGGGPNLVITGFQTTGTPGQRKLTVQNIGGGMTADFNVYVRDTAGKTYWSGRSGPLYGQSEAQSVSWTVPIGGFPCSPVQILVDPENA